MALDVDEAGTDDHARCADYRGGVTAVERSWRGDGGDAVAADGEIAVTPRAADPSTSLPLTIKVSNLSISLCCLMHGWQRGCQVGSRCLNLITPHLPGAAQAALYCN